MSKGDDDTWLDTLNVASKDGLATPFQSHGPDVCYLKTQGPMWLLVTIWMTQKTEHFHHDRKSTKQHWSLMLRRWKSLEDLHEVSTKHSGNVSLAETNCPQHPDVTLHYETLPSGRQPHSWWPYFLASLSPLGMIM